MVKHSFNRFTLFKLFRDSIGDSQARAPLGQQTEESVVRPNAVPTQEPTGTFRENRYHATGQLKTFPVQRASSKQAVSS